MNNFFTGFGHTDLSYFLKSDKYDSINHLSFFKFLNLRNKYIPISSILNNENQKINYLSFDEYTSRYISYIRINNFFHLKYFLRDCFKNINHNSYKEMFFKNGFIFIKDSNSYYINNILGCLLVKNKIYKNILDIKYDDLIFVYDENYLKQLSILSNIAFNHILNLYKKSNIETLKIENISKYVFIDIEIKSNTIDGFINIKNKIIKECII
jgi:hypothetical protein